MRSLFDIQVNGFGGVDFQQKGLPGERLREAIDALMKCETRRFFATFVTDGLDALQAKLEHFEQLRSQDPVIGEAVCGYHLEGPWLSSEPGYRGAHDPCFMKAPLVDEFFRLHDAAEGNIRLVTLAPELPGSAEFVRVLISQGVHVSIGHSNASCSEIDAAIEAGARFCTHLGNAAPAQLPRHDNVVQRLLARDELTAFFIPDGHHLPPFVLKNFFRAKPAGKALLTTDCMSAAGAPCGTYRLGAIETEVGEDRIVRLPGSSLFAGSCLTPLEAVSNASKWLGLGVTEARSLMSETVASAFGISLPQI